MKREATGIVTFVTKANCIEQQKINGSGCTG